MQRGPHVPVRVDEARQHDGASPVDRRSPGTQVRPDVDDCAVSYMNIGIGQISDVVVHAQHVSPANDELATLW
jgi:hypothetical protein